MTRLLAAVAAALVLTGCGNWAEPPEQVGRVGVMLDEQGEIVVVVAPCREGVARVTIARGRTPDMADDEPNAEVGEWTAAAPSSRTSLLTLGAPKDGWSGEPASPPSSDELWIVDASFVDQDDTVLPGPTLTGRDLAGLTAGSLLTQEGTEARAGFTGDC